MQKQKNSNRKDPCKPRNQHSHSTPTTTPMMPQAKATGLFFTHCNVGTVTGQHTIGRSRKRGSHKGRGHRLCTGRRAKPAALAEV